MNMGKSGPLVTVAIKRKKWQDIVAAIHACGVLLKTADTSDMRGTFMRLPDSLRRCQDSLPDRRGTSKRLLYSLRRCQDHLGTCRRPRDRLRRGQIIYQTGETSTENS
ncbi:hypothetical protein DPMN_191227 [Dreissena polymorpha]|uniref:Uncharacterized protein n=1 Tax=Dreissena polymorpha TaxID=45954 RepID=A0A9D3Y251_DREPO|nr:hypothetical protein DPMN_191227 [Dreissena polymorpha]